MKNLVLLISLFSTFFILVFNVKGYIKTIPDLYGSDVNISTSQDFSRFARLRLGVLTNNGIVGLILVFISLIVFLRFSVAISA